MANPNNVVSWFEIPATDIKRACDFYKKVLGKEITMTEMGGGKMGMFPMGMDSVSGAIVQMEGYKPSADGTVVYLNGGKDLSEALSKVEPAGGKVVKPKFGIGEHGFIAFFMDTEGNKVALHSMN